MYVSVCDSVSACVLVCGHVCICVATYLSQCVRQTLTPEHPDTTRWGPLLVLWGYLCLPRPVSDTLGGMAELETGVGR